MNPAEIELAINALVLAIQLIAREIGNSLNLTDDQKKAYIGRLTAAQASVPEWK